MSWRIKDLKYGVWTPDQAKRLHGVYPSYDDAYDVLEQLTIDSAVRWGQCSSEDLCVVEVDDDPPYAPPLRPRLSEVEDERIALRGTYNRRGEPAAPVAIIILAVTPDGDVDDCLSEATDYVRGLYELSRDVSSITCEGWEGGEDGPRERVLVEVRL